MKKLGILLIGVMLISLSCKKKDLDQPTINTFPQGNVWTVGQILDSLAVAPFSFNKEEDKNATVMGYVIADETHGNIYRSFYLRGEDDRCISVNRISGSEDFTVRIGDYVGVSLYGMDVTTYNKLPQIQALELNPNQHVKIYQRGMMDKVQPIDATIADIKAGTYLCNLVKLNNVQFEVYDNLAYADGQYAASRTILSYDDECEETGSIIVRTSNKASFALDPLPSGKGTMTVIVSVYTKNDYISAGDWQLLIRRPSDVNLTSHRCGGGGELMDLPYEQSFESAFGTYTTKSVIGDQVWHIDYHAATITGYVAKAYYENEDWLISSPVDLTAVDKAVMDVNYGAKYFNGNSINNDVTFWVSDNYEFDEAPSTATWTQIPSDIHNNGFSFEDVELVIPTEYVGKIVNVAVKYTSTNSAAGTMEVKSILIREGEPGPQPATILNETFASGQGNFTIQDVIKPQEISNIWTHDASYSCMKANAFSGGGLASESWLISPAIDMSNYTSAVLTFDHAMNYLQSGAPADFCTVMVSTDYQEGSPATATWTELNVTNYPTGSSWSFVASGSVDMSAYLNNNNVHIAFKYTSEVGNAGCWEVKNVLIKEIN